MAELGETNDPTELIQGRPEAIDENVRVLISRAGEAGNAGDGLKAINTGAWTGPGAQAFQDKYSYEPSKWYAAADALQASGGALSDYAETLRWAQARATEAIAQWNQAQATTQQAKTQHDVVSQQAAAQNQPTPSVTDPGEAGRQAARDILDRARAQLASVGNVVAQTLSSNANAAPQQSSWLDDAGNFLANAGASLVNGVASFGNAIINHPGETLAMAAGAAGMIAGVSGEIGGGLLDATGIGAIGGVPLNIASAGLIATGAAGAAAGAGKLAAHAASDDHVQVMQTNADSAGGDSAPPPERPSGVPEDWSPRLAQGDGTVWQKPGSYRNANSVRVMEPGTDPRYPNGYVKFTNEHNQPVDLDGKPGGAATTHIPRNPDGSYPVPKGWTQ